MRRLTRLVAMTSVGATLLALPAFVGCAHRDPAPPPTTEPSAGLADPTSQPAVRPEEAMVYLDRLLDDDSRLVVVSHETAGELDRDGRKKLRAAMKNWWRSVEVDTSGTPFRITPEMAITVYGRGSAAEKDPRRVGPAAVQVQIFTHRNLARVLVTDPRQERLSEAVYVVHSSEPAQWVAKLFAGKL